MINHDCDLEYFKFIRQEILDRIGIHYKTLVTKFILVGAIFAFSLANSDKLGLSAFLLASVFSFLFDILLLENLGWIKSAGKYVKDKIEDDSFSVRWEHDFAHYGGKWHCFSRWAYYLGVWSIGLALFVGFCASADTKASFTIRNADTLLALFDSFLLVYSGLLTWFKLK